MLRCCVASFSLRELFTVSRKLTTSVRRSFPQSSPSKNSMKGIWRLKGNTRRLE